MRLRIRPIQIDPLLHDGLVVVVERHPARVVGARAAQVPGLDLERVEAAVAVGVQPFADRVAVEGGFDVLGPVASVGENAAHGVAGVGNDDIGRVRHDQELHGTIERHHARHADRKTVDGLPIALAAFGLVVQALDQPGLIFRGERCLLPQPDRLGGSNGA